MNGHLFLLRLMFDAASRGQAQRYFVDNGGYCRFPPPECGPLPGEPTDSRIKTRQGSSRAGHSARRILRRLMNEEQGGEKLEAAE